jgi:hypothetical protein
LDFCVYKVVAEHQSANHFTLKLKKAGVFPVVILDFCGNGAIIIYLMMGALILLYFDFCPTFFIDF